MKPNLLYAFYAALVVLTGTTSCKDDFDGSNLPPVANAGDDITINLTSCQAANGMAELDGSGSVDPDGMYLRHWWRKIWGPIGGEVQQSASVKAKVEGLTTGIYAYELNTMDWGKLTDMDTVLVVVRSTPKEYDLDLSFTAPYHFGAGDEESSWWAGIPVPNHLTSVEGKADVASLGTLTVRMQEYSNAATNSTEVYESWMNVSVGNSHTASLSGSTTLNLKRAIVQGGGTFSGELKPTSSSVQNCTGTPPSSLQTLAVSGSLNTTTKTITMRISGKVTF